LFGLRAHPKPAKPAAVEAAAAGESIRQTAGRVPYSLAANWLPEPEVSPGELGGASCWPKLAQVGGAQLGDNLCAVCDNCRQWCQSAVGRS